MVVTKCGSGWRCIGYSGSPSRVWAMVLPWMWTWLGPCYTCLWCGTWTSGWAHGTAQNVFCECASLSGREERKGQQKWTKQKKKKAKGSRGQLGAGRRVAVGKKMRGCNDASHEKGLERDPDRSINCWLMLIHHPLPQSKRIWQLGVLQRSFFRWKFGENDWQRRHCYRLTPVSWWSCLIV